LKINRLKLSHPVSFQTGWMLDQYFNGCPCKK
jgi:hypothetical protein